MGAARVVPAGPMLDSRRPATRTARMPASPLTRLAGPLLLALGVAAYLIGLHQHGAPWAPVRAAARDTMWALLLAWLAIALLSRLTGRFDAVRGFAMALAALWILAGGLPEILGPLGVLAAGAVVASLLPAAGLPVLVRLIAGLAAVAALAGWLLPFPVHHTLAWISLIVAGVAWRRRPLRDLWRELRRELRDDLRGGGAGLWLYACIALVALLPALMPRLAPDDLAYHLILPRELLAFGHSRLDAGSQAWIMAPWSLDLLHGIAWVIAGDEPVTAGLNLFWLLAAGLLCARIGREMGLPARPAWIAAALFTSIPLVAHQSGNLQVEAASPAIFAALYLAASRLPAQPGALLLTAALAGFLVGCKISNGLLALPIAAWMLWRLRGAWPRPRAWAAAVALGAFVGGSSYFWATLLAGNPVLPLFNGVFGSPYFLPINWKDSIWQLPWGPGLPWDLVFDTDRYMTALPGALGAFWLVLAGALPWALRDARLRPALLLALAGFLLVFAQVQYVRYALPVLTLLAPALFAGLWQVAPRSTAWTAGVLAVLQVFAMPTANWVLGQRAFKLALEGGHALLEARFAADEPLGRRFLQEAGPGDRLLYTDRFRVGIAHAPGRAHTVAWYDAELSSIFNAGGGYTDAAAWRRALAASGANYLVVTRGEDNPGLRDLLAANRAQWVAESDLSLLYRLALEQEMPAQLEAGVFRARFARDDLDSAVTGSAWIELGCDQPGQPIAVGWTLLGEAGQPVVNHWTWIACGADGRARSRVAVQASAAWRLLQVEARPAPPAPDLVLTAIDARADLRRDLLADRSPVLRHARWFCPPLLPGCRRDWATLTPQP